MTGKKKFFYTLIAAIGAAVLIAGASRLFLNQEIPEHTPGNSAETQEHNDEQPTEIDGTKEITVGEETLLSVVQQTLDGNLTVSDLSIEIQDNAVISMSGSVNKSDIATLLQTQDDSISSAYGVVLGILPDSLPLVFQVQLQANNQTITVTPKSITISSMEIPDSITQNIFTTIEQNLNRELSKQFSQVQSVSSKDNSLVISGT